MKKIKLFAWWIDTPRLTERFKKQFIGSYFNRSDIEIVLDDTYDYAIIFGFTREKIKTDKDHTLIFFQEPHWSHNWDREAHTKSNRVYCTSKKLFGEFNEYIESTPYMFYGGHGDEYFEVDNIINYNNINKQKNTSFVVTNRFASPLDGTHNHNIYRERVLLAQHFLETPSNVDIYGFLWEYSHYTSLNLKGTTHTKYTALHDYKFSIAIENSNEYNYITEKLYDVLFFNTVPVYSGATNINHILDIKDLIIPLEDINNTQECADKINALTDADYFSRIDKINEFKINFFKNSKYSIWQKIIEEVNKSI